MKNKWFIIFIVALIAIGGFYLYNKYKRPPFIYFDKLSLTTLENQKFELKRLKGKKIILSFGASWCPNCIEELNDISNVKDLELKDVEVVVISDESIERVIEFKNKRQYNFTFLKMNQSFQSIGINSIPTTYIFNKNFELKKQNVGYLDWTDASTLQHLKALMD
jgi:peroxiredoxin